MDKELLDWIVGWSKITPDSLYGQGYRDAMLDILEKIEDMNDCSESNSTQYSK